MNNCSQPVYPEMNLPEKRRVFSEIKEEIYFRFEEIKILLEELESIQNQTSEQSISVYRSNFIRARNIDRRISALLAKGEAISSNIVREKRCIRENRKKKND